MTLTTITTHVEPGDAAALDAALAAPFALAETYRAHLTALVFHAEATLAEAAQPGHELSAQEEAAVAHLRAAAARRDIACDVRARSSFAYGVGDVLADHLRVSDLALLALPGAPGPGRRMLINAALFDSGRPLLLVPARRQLGLPAARVVVAWDASPAAVRAVHGALPLIATAAETIVVTVTDDKELRMGQSGIELTRLLARHGARASFAALPRAAGGVLATLTAKTAEVEGGLLVMGAMRHSPIRDLVFGSATRDLLDSAPPVPVLLAA